jgi:hypothetical protein
MIEARIFTDSLEPARSVLRREDAVLAGAYKIHDTIYRSRNEDVPLIDEFLRLRVIPENIWDEKAVILAVKQTQLHTTGKHSLVPLKLQFDEREAAEAYYGQNLKDAYVRDFEFWRIGWQYILHSSAVIDLEIIENKHPSIELKAETEEAMEKLLDTFNVQRGDVIVGPSVVAIRSLLEI